MNLADHVRLVLKYTYALLFLVVGIDKLGLNLIVDWSTYVSPFVASVLPFSVGTFLIVWGVIEIAVGILILSPLTRTGVILGIVLLALIVLNLLPLGMYDIAARDVVMGIGMYCLYYLSVPTLHRR